MNEKKKKTMKGNFLITLSLVKNERFFESNLVNAVLNILVSDGWKCYCSETKPAKHQKLSYRTAAGIKNHAITKYSFLEVKRNRNSSV